MSGGGGVSGGMTGGGTSSAPVFPFSALVGQDQLVTALLVGAVSPAVGGVLVRGEKGTAKSTAVRALTRLLPGVQVITGCRFACDPSAPDPSCPDGPHPQSAPAERRPARLVELPVGASTDRLAGSLDLERALVEGVSVFEPGLLASAHRGLLYVDEVNLLADHLVDLLLDAAALGVNYVEREGVSVRHAARFLLVGTMNPEEGELRPQLLDRFGLSVDVAASREPAERGEIVRRQLAFEDDPGAFAGRFSAGDREVGELIRRARSALPAVRLPDRALARITGTCAELEVDGLRADIVTAKAAAALAALGGRDEITDEDVRGGALLALSHRRRRGPLERPGLGEGELDRVLAELGKDEDPPPDAGSSGRDGASPQRDGADAPREPPESPASPSSQAGDPPPARAPASTRAPEPAGSRTQAPGPAGSRTQAPGAAGSRTEAAEGDFRAPVVEVSGAGGGAWGRRSRARSETGRPVGDRAHTPGAGLAAVATLRSAAPKQRRRGRTGRGIRLARSDLRSPIHDSREGNLVLFVVDASGSMGARRRMSAVKGAVLALLVDAYQRRDEVGLVIFRDAGAEVLLPPTGSVEVAAARLSEIPTGGRTPLAAGLERAGEVLARERVRDPRRRPLVFLVTDGRANAAGPRADGDPRANAGDPRATANPRASAGGPRGSTPASAAEAAEAAERAATRLVADGAGLVVLDTEEGPARLGLARRLATVASAPILALDELEGQRLASIVKATAGRAA